MLFLSMFRESGLWSSGTLRHEKASAKAPDAAYSYGQKKSDNSAVLVLL